jgi:N-acetylneuraminic acid mutarotase
MSAGASFGLAACAKAVSNTAPMRGTWSTALSLPEAVQEIYPCAHGGRLHLAGGFIATEGRISGPTASHYSWGVGETVWRKETPLPIARHHPHMVSFQGRLLAIAGFESPNADAAWSIQNTGWVLNGDVWEDFPALPAPAAEAVVAKTGDGVLHLAGGRTWAAKNQTGGWRDHVDTDHHFVLSDINRPWESAAPCPHKRNSTAGAVIDGQLHIVGGRQVGGGNLVHHTVYDYKEDRWRDAAPMPQAQGGLAAASLGGKLYAFGGEYFDNGGGVYPECWVYDPKSDSWSALPDMPNPRHGLGAVTLGEKIYVIGGALQASGVETSALVEVFEAS